MFEEIFQLHIPYSYQRLKKRNHQTLVIIISYTHMREYACETESHNHFIIRMIRCFWAVTRNVRKL